MSLIWAAIAIICTICSISCAVLQWMASYDLRTRVESLERSMQSSYARWGKLEGSVKEQVQQYLADQRNEDRGGSGMGEQMMQMMMPMLMQNMMGGAAQGGPSSQAGGDASPTVPEWTIQQTEDEPRD